MHARQVQHADAAPLADATDEARLALIVHRIADLNGRRFLRVNIMLSFA